MTGADAEIRVCGFCGADLVRCPAVPALWIDAIPGPARGECPKSTGGHQAWPPATLAVVRLPQRLAATEAISGRVRPSGVRKPPPAAAHQQGSLFDGEAS